MTLVDRLCIQWESITGTVPEWRVWPDRTDLQLGHMTLYKHDISSMYDLSDTQLADWLRAKGLKNGS